MWIEGKSADGNFMLLYRDTANITKCTSSMYGANDTSPCADVLLIPINNTHHLQFIKIYVANYLQLCEVQVFAGKGQYAIILWYL